VAYITLDITFCLLYSFCVVFFFSGQLSVLLPCCPALLYFLLHILNCFIELINDDDDDDENLE